MKKIIYKFHLVKSGINAVKMPIGSKILTAQFQGEYIDIWAECYLEKVYEFRRFQLIMTGEEIEEDCNIELIYISTSQNIDGYVIHVYERIEIK